ncbi:MAG TPA: hypothetical protein VGL21_10540 [Jatrophihabitantaceae bacterium]|jgi:hypothetical protein
MADMKMDVDELNTALEILKKIPKILDGTEAPTGGKPIGDLKSLAGTQEVTGALKGFAANGGSAQSAVSGWINERNAAIQQEVTTLQSACGGLAQKLAASMNSYTGTDKYNADDVSKSGPDSSGNGRAPAS